MKKKSTHWPILPCRRCGRWTRTRFVIADDIENPMPYHKTCYSRLMIDVMIELAKRKA